MNCVILTTDTYHHRSFCNAISSIIKTSIVLEKKKNTHKKKAINELLTNRSISATLNNHYIQFHPIFDYHEKRFEYIRFGSTITSFSGYHSIFSTNDVNDERCVRWIHSCSPDIIISFGTGLIKHEILSLKCKKINIHRGILPKYRGLDSDLWACYYNDFDNIGTTIHEIESEFDTGSILMQDRLILRSDMKLFQLRYYTTLIAISQVRKIIIDYIKKSQYDVLPQNIRLGNYYSYIPLIKRKKAEKNFYAYLRDQP